MFTIRVALTVPLILFILNACTMVGPDYKQPKTEVADQWISFGYQGEQHDAKVHATQDTAWWQSFHDPILTHLIEEGYHHNLSLQSTGVKVLQARAQLAQAVGEFYPQQQGLSSNYTYQAMGKSSQYANIVPANFDVASTSIAASWEIDFWGKYRRAIRANDANFLASVAAYDSALVSLTAEIGSRYVAIRLYQQQIAVTKKDIVLQQQNLDLMQTRYQAGKADLSDLEQAITTLNQTIASLPPLQINLQQQKDALAVLLGTTPNKIDAFLQKNNTAIPLAPTTIALGIPKDVLRQRPDVQQAQLQAILQSESIGAIKAQLYPALSLSGSFGYSSSNVNQSTINDIFQWSNHTVSIGPALYLPLFNYGQITNQVRAQDALFQQAILNYQNVVLTAQKEVQDGIVSYMESQKSLQAMRLANAAALKTTQLTLARYQAGQVDYSAMLQAQEQQITIEMSLLDAQSRVPQGLISLYRALGGGWQIRQGHDIVPEAITKQMQDRTHWGNLLKNQQSPSTILPSE